MLDHSPATDRALSRAGGALSRPVDGSDAGALDAGWAQRIQACRAAYLVQPPGARLGLLQTIGLGRLRARLGPRWTELRGRAVALIEQALARELGPRRPLCRLGGRPAARRSDRSGPRRGGTPWRAACRRGHQPSLGHGPPRRQPECPHAAVRRRCPAARSDDLGRAARMPRPLRAASGTAARASRQWGSRRDCSPAFSRSCNLRKRLVSAYRLTAWAEGVAFSPSPPDALAAALDEWSLRHALELCRQPAQGRVPALVLPVHYATLAGMRQRELFTQHCRLLPASSARQLVFEVLGSARQACPRPGCAS